MGGLKFSCIDDFFFFWKCKREDHSIKRNVDDRNVYDKALMIAIIYVDFLVSLYKEKC